MPGVCATTAGRTFGPGLRCRRTLEWTSPGKNMNEEVSGMKKNLLLPRHATVFVLSSDRREELEVLTTF